jgi:hypothetical protein
MNKEIRGIKIVHYFPQQFLKMWVSQLSEFPLETFSVSGSRQKLDIFDNFKLGAMQNLFARKNSLKNLLVRRSSLDEFPVMCQLYRFACQYFWQLRRSSGGFERARAVVVRKKEFLLTAHPHKTFVRPWVRRSNFVRVFLSVSTIPTYKFACSYFISLQLNEHFITYLKVCIAYVYRGIHNKYKNLKNLKRNKDTWFIPFCAAGIWSLYLRNRHRNHYMRLHMYVPMYKARISYHSFANISTVGKSPVSRD